MVCTVAHQKKKPPLSRLAVVPGTSEAASSSVAAVESVQALVAFERPGASTPRLIRGSDQMCTRSSLFHHTDQAMPINGVDFSPLAASILKDATPQNSLKADDSVA